MRTSGLILSGGLDSVTLLYKYQNEIGLCISFNYGSKHNHKELEFAKYHCKKLGIEHIIIDLPFINQYFNSSLLKSGEAIPEGHYAADNMKSTVVPFRNGIMLSISVGILESRGLEKLFIANHAGDHHIYPDCRPEFISNMNTAIQAGTNNNIYLTAPFTHLNKRDIALIGKELKIAYSKTWTCYKGGIKQCGVCGSCIERKEALEGFDNTEYLQ